MSRLKVKITGVEKKDNNNPIITLEAKHDFNIVKFMHIANDFSWELVATAKEIPQYVCLTTVPTFNADFKKKFRKCYCDKDLENLSKEVYGLREMVFQIPQKNNNMLIVNKEKKYVLLKLNGKEYRVDCHKEDEFDWQIGFGLALSQCYGRKSKWEDMREFYRNENRKLNYKEYAKWCIVEYFKNDMIEINNLKNKIKEINEYGKVDL